MENIEEYTRDVVTKCVIKICWALGFTSLSSVSAQVLTDVTNRYMKDMCVSLHQYMNVYGHLSPTLGDCSLTMLNLAVTANNLEDFAQNVFPILLDEKIPRYPIQSQPKLNFLKPGSREVVTRAVHIHEHLPAMYPDVSDEGGNGNFDARSSSLDAIGNLESGSGSSATAINGGLPSLSSNCDLFKRTATSSSSADQETASPTSSSSGMLKKSKLASEERVRPTRELSCVVMTTSGFLTTKREGKMPEARIPLALTNFTVVSNASGGSADTNGSAATPTAKSGEQLKVKQSSGTNNSNNSNGSNGTKDGVASCKPPPEKKMKLAEEQPTKELPVSREQQPEQQEDRSHSVKSAVAKSATKGATSLETTSSLSSGSPPLSDTIKSKQPAEKPARTVAHSPTSPIKTQKQSLSDRRDSEGAEERETVVDGKLTTEPDRVKLSIFKKITKSRDDSKVPPPLPDQSAGNAVSASNAKETELSTGSKKSHHKEQAAEVGVANNNSGPKAKAKVGAANNKAQVVKVKKITKAGKLSKRQKKLKHLSAAAEKMKRRKSQQTIESAPSPPSSPMEAKKDIIKPAVPMNNSNQPPPPMYPFLSSFTSGAGSLLPSSLSQNPLIPKFVPFPSAPLSGKLSTHTPAVPHPAMPNLPLPPPGMMQVISDDRSKATSKGHGGNAAASGGEFEPEASRDPDEELPVQATADTKKLKKEHKKLKKDKKDREKKKKEKRDKVKNVKKVKAGKNKREKNSQKDDKSNAVDSNESGAKLPPVEVVPKLKLKLGSSSPQLSSSSAVTAASSVASQSPKITIKPIVKKTANEFRREPSPELAKINALVGKPVKHKSTESSSSSKFNFVDPLVINMPAAPVTPSTTSSKKQQEKTRSRAVKEKSSSGRGKRSSAATLETNEPKHAPFYYDDDGNQIWVCPSCGAQDDGSPMIGCDGCDAWYHWVCVGIKSAPESAKWFCSFCRRK